ncbi:hypothetical protein [Pseudomonas sp.]|jgi:hypothetical protein|uniref:hypothetical protein n=1 Tax=Pseudomonas sp. TaxID=306 RepID=UPI002E309116|nr:hypothetical protein [Pseudomonas sp.]HEX4550150.1 hypothetical protein [Pseudomonas sp.]
MPLIAEHGIKIDSADAIEAKTSLDEMAKAGGRAEQSAVLLINEMQALENLQSQMQVVAEKVVADSWRAGGTSFRNANGRT